jgi:hypothetical protein
MTLAAMAAVREAVERERRTTVKDSSEAEDALGAEELVALVTDSLAPILLPTIDALGSLRPEDLAGPSALGMDDEELGAGEEAG